MKFCWALLVLVALVIAETVATEGNNKNSDIQRYELHDKGIDASREGRARRNFHKTHNMDLIGRMVDNLADEDLEALERAIRTRERIRRRETIGTVSNNGKKRKSSSNKNKNKKTKGSRNGVKRRKNNVVKRRKTKNRPNAQINRKTKRPVKEQFQNYDAVSYDDVDNFNVNNDDVNNDTINNEDINNENMNTDNINKEEENNDSATAQNNDVYEEEVHKFQRGDGKPITVMIIEEALK